MEFKPVQHEPLDPARLARVRVVGSSCSGKSTFSKRLAAALGSEHIELDALHWLPNWQERPNEEMAELAAQAAARDRWVIEGNYNWLSEVTYPPATALIWLNYSKRVTFSRALRRTIRRAWTREELFAGNRESVRQSFASRDSILLWVFKTHGSYRAAYRKFFDGDEYPHLLRIEHTTPRETEAFLRGLEEKNTSHG